MDLTNEKTRKLMITACVLLVATLCAGIYYLNESGQLNWFGKTIEIPNLVGKSKDEVKAWVEANGLEESFVTYSYVYDDKVELDHVVSQNVEPNTKIKQSEHLELDVSGGADPDQAITIPDFKGQSMKEVSEWFKTNGFSFVSYAFKKDKALEKDQFISCEPNVGETVKRSDKIIVTFSSGDEVDENEEITVPDFKPILFDQMVAWGKENSITVIFDFDYNDKIGKGQFIKQSVEAGKTMKPGERIVITLSNGKAVQIESFIGKTKKEATAWCKQNNVTPVFVNVYAKEKEGTIVGQSTVKGSVTKNSKITFSIASGLVPLQNYEGHTKDEFNGYIAWLNNEAYKSAKLTYDVVEVSSDKKPGTIIEQNPKTPCNPGTKVTIKIATIGKVTVDNKKGSSEDEFKKYITGLGLKIGNRTEEFNDGVSAGCIVSNTTGTFDAGSNVSYVVSKGSYSFDPNPYLKQGEAFNMANFNEAKNHGWNVTTNETFSDQAKGTIVSSSVDGKNITVTLSKGQDSRITVANVVGKSVDQAKAALNGLNVIVYENPNWSDKDDKGIVIAQSVNANEKLNPNDKIAITISKGKEPVVEPEVVTKALPNISIPALNISISANCKDYDSVVNYMRNQLSGFTNVNYVPVTDVPDVGLKVYEVSPSFDGSTVSVDTPITVKIGQPS